MGSSPMEKIGECNGVTLYFADSRFERPGVYYWDGTDNVRVWPPEPPNPPQPSASVGVRAREFLATEYRGHGWHEDAGRLCMGGEVTSFVEDDALRVIGRLIEEGDEDTHVITAMGRLLAAIAIILKGPEPAGTAWSYHDLPSLVASALSEPRQVAAEMKAWAHTKMAEQGSSRRDKMMVAEWAKRLLPEALFPIKDFDIEGMSITKDEAREAVKQVAIESALTTAAVDERLIPASWAEGDQIKTVRADDGRELNAGLSDGEHDEMPLANPASREIGWLIEHADASPPMWFRGHSEISGESEWTHDAAVAIRFTRKQDAEQALRTMVPRTYFMEHFVSEHVWMTTAAAGVGEVGNG